MLRNESTTLIGSSESETGAYTIFRLGATPFSPRTLDPYFPKIPDVTIPPRLIPSGHVTPSHGISASVGAAPVGWVSIVDGLMVFFLTRGLLVQVRFATRFICLNRPEIEIHLTIYPFQNRVIYVSISCR